MRHLVFFLTTIALFAVCLPIYSQDYRGKYVSFNGIEEIEINDSCFIYMNYLLEIDNGPMLCRYDIQKLADDFFEINSKETDFVIAAGGTLDYSESNNPDSISVSINTPSTISTYCVNLCTSGTLGEITIYSTDFLIKNGKGHAYIPRTIPDHNWEITIHPKDPNYDLIERLSRGLAFDSFLIRDIDTSKDIFITLPALTDEFFLRYYIRGEYIRIVDDTLYWHGNVYKKTERRDVINKKLRPSRRKSICEFGGRRGSKRENSGI